MTAAANFERMRMVRVVIGGLLLGACGSPESEESGGSFGDGSSTTSTSGPTGGIESTGASGVDADSSSADTSTSTTSTSTGVDDDTPPSGGVGAACDHELASDVIPDAQLVSTDADCEGGVCVYADPTEPPGIRCADDSECNEINPALDAFECGSDAMCSLSADYFHARSHCSHECEDDTDCADVDTTTCETGFRCAAITMAGPLCCRRVCACEEDIDDANASEVYEACVLGSPECCVEQPGEGLCPS
jgi:hypothetical protein